MAALRAATQVVANLVQDLEAGATPPILPWQQGDEEWARARDLAILVLYLEVSQEVT